MRKREPLAFSSFFSVILNVEDAATCDRYKVIWKHELDFVLSEYDLRIARLQQLRDELAKLA